MKRDSKKTREKSTTESLQSEPYPRPVPWHWTFVMLNRGFWLTFILIISLLIPFILILFFILKQAVHLELPMHFPVSVSVCVAAGIVLIISSIIILVNYRKYYLLKYGISTIPEVLSSTLMAGYSEAPNVIHKGWKIIDVNEDKKIYRKECILKDEQGNSVTFTRKYAAEEMPVFLCHPKNIRNFIGVDSLPFHQTIGTAGGKLIDRSEDFLAKLLEGKPRRTSRFIAALFGYIVITISFVVFLLFLGKLLF